MTIPGSILSIAQLFVVLALLYHWWLLAASIPNPRIAKTRESAGRKRSFALAIPAHNEAAVIGDTVAHLQGIQYPQALHDVFVVADHCSDSTAATAREAGAIVYERSDGPKGRKGHALSWLLQKIMSEHPQCDAIVVLDADSRLNARFLEEMNAGLEQGYPALQGQHIISNGHNTFYNRWASIDMRINNRIRNRARQNLGFPCRLMGDAMCFSRQVLLQFPWHTASLTEDVEYGIHLLRNGIQIGYVPQAKSYGQAAGGWQNAEKQRLRWEGGALALRRQAGLKLLWQGLKERRAALIDRGVELVLPPYSWLAASSLLLFLIQALTAPQGSLLSPTGMGVITGAWIAFPFVALIIDGAPFGLLATLLFGPLYLAWRLWISALVAIRRGSVQWIRTPRREEG